MAKIACVACHILGGYCGDKRFRYNSHHNPLTSAEIFIPGPSALRLQVQGRKLLQLLIKHNIPVDGASMLHKKEVEHTTLTWDVYLPGYDHGHGGREVLENRFVQVGDSLFVASWPDGASVADLVLDSRQPAAPIMQNMVRQALKLLEQHGIELPEKELGILDREPIQLLEMPEEILGLITHHVVRKDRGPNWDTPGKIPIYDAADWNETLDPLRACKALRRAGMKEIFMANTGTSQVVVEKQITHGRSQPLVLSQRFPSDIALGLRSLEITLSFGDFYAPEEEQVYDPLDIPGHNFCAQIAIETLQSIPAVHPRLKHLRVFLDVNQRRDGDGFFMHYRKAIGEVNTIQAVRRNLVELTDTMQALPIDTKDIRLLPVDKYVEENDAWKDVRDGKCMCKNVVDHEEFCTKCTAEQWMLHLDDVRSARFYGKTPKITHEEENEEQLWGFGWRR